MMPTPDIYSVHNPFPPDDVDRRAIWDMLVARDIAAFVAQDWPAHASDFDPQGFFGINAGGSLDPDAWAASYPDMTSYSAQWLGFAQATACKAYAEDIGLAHLRASHLHQIDICADMAVAKKKFNGHIALADGTAERLLWQTVYICRRRDNRWWISGFVGFMANPADGQQGE